MIRYNTIRHDTIAYYDAISWCALSAVGTCSSEAILCVWLFCAILLGVGVTTVRVTTVQYSMNTTILPPKHKLRRPCSSC